MKSTQHLDGCTKVYMMIKAIRSRDHAAASFYRRRPPPLFFDANILWKACHVQAYMRAVHLAKQALLANATGDESFLIRTDIYIFARHFDGNCLPSLCS